MPSNGFAKLYRDSVADLAVAIYQLTFEYPVVREGLNTGVLLNGERAVFLRVGKVGGRHSGAGNEGWCGPIPSEPAVEPNFTTTGFVGFSHR